MKTKKKENQVPPNYGFHLSILLFHQHLFFFIHIMLYGFQEWPFSVYKKQNGARIGHSNNNNNESPKRYRKRTSLHNLKKKKVEEPKRKEFLHTNVFQAKQSKQNVLFSKK